MSMFLQLLCIHMCCWQSLHLASGAFLDFRLDTIDPNYLILECYNSQTGIISSTASFDFFTPGSPIFHRTQHSSTGLPHTVTLTYEVLIRCTTRDGSTVESDLVAIAGTIYSRL